VITENAGYKIMNSRKSNLQIVRELWLGENVDKTFSNEQPAPLTKEEKRAFLESVKNFSALGESIYGKGDLRELTERVRDIVEKAQRIVTEDADWFDEVAHKKASKRLEEDYKMFEETAKQMSQLQQRLSMAYENIGQALNRYYDVG
jgi:hypothetical protein